jgi:integrase/recombinase XerD
MTADLVPAHPVDNPDARIRELTKQWLAGRKSDHTRAAYLLDLKSWLAWCQAHNVHALAARHGHIMEWLAALAEGDPLVGRRPESGSTRARRLGAISGWYRWLIRHQAANRNPANLDKGERPVLAPRRAPALSDDQTERMLAAADADRNLRTAAIVWLLLTTGIRVGELIAANVADIGQDRGVTVLHVHGKGGKTRMVEMEPHTLDRVLAYLATRRDHDMAPVLAAQAGAGGDRPLIATARGLRLDRKAIRLLLRRLARKAGLPGELVDRLTPHSTRATYVTAAIEDGVPVRDIQRSVGHVSPVTTEGYDRSAWSPDRSPSRRVAKRFHAARVDAARHASSSNAEDLAPGLDKEGTAR